MYNLLQNEHFWIDICFFLFFILFGKIIYVQFKAFLEGQIEAVKQNISSSEIPLTKSSEELRVNKNQLKDVEKQISIILERSKESGNNLTEAFHENLSLKINSTEESFKNYLLLEKEAKYTNLRKSLVNHSTNLSFEIIRTALSTEQKTALLNQSIDKLPDVLNKINVF